MTAVSSRPWWRSLFATRHSHARGRQPPSARPQGDGRVAERHRVGGRLEGDARGRQRHRRRRRHRLRAGGHPPRRRQHRRRRLHRLPRGGRHRHHLRLPRDGAGRLEPDDVDEGRQVRLRRPPQHPPIGRRARHGGRAAPGVAEARQQALEGPGDAGGGAGPRRLRGQRRVWRSRSRRSSIPTSSRSIRRRSPSSRRTASRTSRARRSSSRTWPARCSASPIRARPASTRARPPR